VLLLAGKDLQLEAQIFRQSHELSALLLNPQKRVDADDVRRHEVVELQPRGFGPLSTALK
jgi:hypothetical protein